MNFRRHSDDYRYVGVALERPSVHIGTYPIRAAAGIAAANSMRGQVDPDYAQEFFDRILGNHYRLLTLQEYREQREPLMYMRDSGVLLDAAGLTGR